MTQEAINKLNEEFKQATNLSAKENAVKEYVLEVLIMFCNQNREFARAIVRSNQTIADCIKATVKGCGNSISDIEVYKKAVEFYFLGATVKFTMTIDLGDEGFSNDGVSADEDKPRDLQLSLDSLLDF